MAKLFRSIIVALCLVSLGQTAAAQSFPKPPDVPAYVPVTPTYRSGTALNVVGDGSTTGGAAPADSYELAEVAPVTGTDRSSWANSGPFTLALTTKDGGTATEAKARFTFGNKVKILFDDPIRNYGLPGTSHCHTFFGNLSTNAYSTYSTLRGHAVRFSQASGGPLNGTGYWLPCVEKLNPFGDGKNYVVKPSNSIIVYYQESPNNSIKLHRLLLGLRYVGGYDMDSGGVDQSKSTYMEGLVTTANAQTGTAGRYSVCNIGDCLVYAKWKCDRDSGLGELSSSVLKNADGSDPWAGHCTTGRRLWVQFSGPTCWDGVNLWSPGGYKHVIPRIWDSVAHDHVCPNGWYRLPALQFQIEFPHTGFSDYGNWVLSSDISAGKTSTPGITFHTDWFNGWDRTSLTNWLTNCMAIGHEGNTIPHECNSSVTSTTEQLTNAGPTTTTSTATAGDMFELPSQSNGPVTMQVEGHGS